MNSISCNGVWSVPSYGSYSYNDISGSALKNYIQHLAAAFHLLDYCSAGSYCPTAYLTRERTAHLIAVVFIPGMAYQAEPAKGLAVSFPPLPGSVSGAGKALAAPIRALQVPQIATFTYDGDGRRVSSTVNGVTTYFVGSYFEQTGSEITKYYYAGSQRVAMRKTIVPQSTTLTYLLGDHLGSTSLSVDSAGNVLTELRYTAWGQVRYQAGATPTHYTYTGQYSNTADFGLMYYNSRWYDPSLGRIAQADTVVPGGVQGLDRYAYVNNSPLNYVDPSGHFSCENKSGYECRIATNKWQQANQANPGDGLTHDQILQLLGIDSLSAFYNWYASDANRRLYNMLFHARPGDIISLAWGNSSNDAQVFHLMIVMHGSGVAFYDTDHRNLLNSSDMDSFTATSDKFVLDAAIFRDGDRDKTYSIEESLNNMLQNPYTLSDGWNKASDGQGGVVIHKQLNGNDVLGILTVAAGGTTVDTIIAAAGATTAAGVAPAIALVGGIYLIVTAADEYPVYYDRLPVR